MIVSLRYCPARKIWLKVVTIERSSLNGEAFKATAPPHMLLAIRNLIASGAEKIHCAVRMCKIIASNRTRWPRIFEELSLDRGGVELAENLCTSPFNEDLSINTTFSHIHLDKQHLEMRFIKINFQYADSHT